MGRARKINAGSGLGLRASRFTSWRRTLTVPRCAVMRNETPCSEASRFRRRSLFRNSDPLPAPRNGGGRDAGFTLVELLVVIAVIALLMAILLPVLGRVRRQAKAVACQSNLRQWGQILAMYTQENAGYLPYGHMVAAVGLFRGFMPAEEGDASAKPLFLKVRTDGIRCCPMATDEPIGGGIGQTLALREDLPSVTVFTSCAATRSGTWQATEPRPTFIASYGFNAWLLNGYFGWSSVDKRLPYRGVNVYPLRGTTNIPVLGGCTRFGAYPDEWCRPPSVEAAHSREEMDYFCLNRHDGYVNSLFLDWSVRRVGLKQLWTLKWYRDFDTRNKWTTAGGVQPEDWPRWMRRFKDY